MRRLKNSGSRRAVNGSPQMIERPGRFLLVEYKLPVVETDSDELGVVVEVDETLPGRVLLLTGQVGKLIVAVDVHAGKCDRRFASR